MYVRFVIGHTGSPRHRYGIFAETPEEAWLDAEAAARRAWFNERLPVPPFKLIPRTAVCWFRDDAREHLRNMWRLACLLSQQGFPVQKLHTPRPGQIWYADEHQIVADARVHRWRR
jgi:hypothetical protein